jgi:hypothetical protein
VVLKCVRGPFHLAKQRFNVLENVFLWNAFRAAGLIGVMLAAETESG